MFNNKRIKELEKEVLNLQGRMLDTERGLKIQTHLYLNNPLMVHYGYPIDTDRKISISDVLEKLLSALGYEITYNHKPETTSYTLEKTLIPQKQTLKKKK